MSMTYDGTNGITFPDASTQKTAGYTGFRNRIINGAMTNDQRNVGSAMTLNASVQYGLDRWATYFSNSTSSTTQLVFDDPTGFACSQKITIGTGAAPATGSQNLVYQAIEGFNFYDFSFGTINAKSVAVSFWVKSSLTGTFGVSLSNFGNSRSYPTTYTISAANTWEYKTITIPGDTTGTWVGATNSVGAALYFSLGAGSTYQGTANTWASADYKTVAGTVNVVATSGATWQVTGVQVEKGSVATPFEYRSYGTELALCQRYYQQLGPRGSASYEAYATGFANSATNANIVIPLKVTMRASPTLITSTISTLQVQAANGSSIALTSLTVSQNSPDNLMVGAVVSSGLSAGNGTWLGANNSATAFIGLGSEL